MPQTPQVDLLKPSDALYGAPERPKSPRHFKTFSKNTVLVSHGRPPWYGENGEHLTKAFVIGIAGGSASGKTHVAQEIIQSLGYLPSVTIISQDSFYKRHTPEEIALAFESRFDLDHPDAIDMPMFYQCVSELKSGQQTTIPIYSFTEHQRLDETKYLYGAAVIIAEGIMALQDPTLRSLYDLKIFVQCDPDLMLARRIKRDVTQRGRDVNGILEQYLRYVKPSYDNFVRPTATYADIIVPGHDNRVAIDLICTHVRKQLQERSIQFRGQMAIPRTPTGDTSQVSLEALNLIVLPSTPQVKGILTIVRDNTTPRADFIFFLDRLATKLIDYSLCNLTYAPCTIETPTGISCSGKKLAAQIICGVSILRSGGALERGLKRCINDIPVGSLLVQSPVAGGEPMLLHVNLPSCIRDRKSAPEARVLLLDAQIGTGAAAMMAIRTLLDHGVKQENIIFVVLLIALGGGIQILRRAFPNVKIVCAEVDHYMEEAWVDDGASPSKRVWTMQPGMGQIGDRYYLS